MHVPHVPCMCRACAVHVPCISARACAVHVHVHVHVHTHMHTHRSLSASSSARAPCLTAPPAAPFGSLGLDPGPAPTEGRRRLQKLKLYLVCVVGS